MAVRTKQVSCVLPAEVWLKIGQLVSPAEGDEGLTFIRKFRVLKRLSMTCRLTNKALQPLCRAFKTTRVQQVVQRCIEAIMDGSSYNHAFNYYCPLRFHNLSLYYYCGPLGKFIGTSTRLAFHLQITDHPWKRKNLLKLGEHTDFISVLVASSRLQVSKLSAAQLQMLPLRPSSFETIKQHILDGRLSLNEPKVFDWFKVAFESVPLEDETVWKQFIEQNEICGGAADSLVCRKCLEEIGL